MKAKGLEFKYFWSGATYAMLVARNSYILIFNSLFPHSFIRYHCLYLEDGNASVFTCHYKNDNYLYPRD